MSHIFPSILEETSRGERIWDLFSRLLKDRIIFLGAGIDDDVANIITAQLLLLESEDPDKAITMYINSPGGVCTAGLGIYDTMQYIKCPVITVCIGQAASMAAVLLAAGSKGLRKSLPNSRIMIHQPSGGTPQCKASDIVIQANEIVFLKQRLNEILAKHTGQPIEKIITATDRDTFFSASAAKDFGLIDDVIELRKS